MAKFDFRFQDTHSLSKITDEDKQKWKDSFVVASGGRRVLRASIEATHAALVNRNKRWYSPSKMNEGAPTFVNGKKPAKVLKHHDTRSDPVGVVKGSVFVPTVPVDLINDKNVEILMSPTASMKDQIKAMNRLILSGVTSRPDWKGLGYIDLLVDFIDEKTIEQIDSGLFDAVSTSFSSPGHAYCSVCSKNWGQDGYCEHEPGEVYEDEDGNKIPMMLIPGLHLYDEVSLVVHDADPHTVIRVLDEQGETVKQIDCLDIKDDSSFMGNSVFKFQDSVEEEINMTVKLSEKAEKAFGGDSFLSNYIKSIRSEASEDTVIEICNAIAERIQEDGTLDSQTDAELDNETAITYAVEAIENKDTEIDADAIYSEIEKELEAMKDEGVITEEELTDKKLSPETRSKMSESTFCGPNRSFPVPDCAHVTAARRLISRYKGPGDKTKILACVSRKAKALGCGESNDSANSQEQSQCVFEMPSCDSMKIASNDEVMALFAKAEAELILRHLKVARECSACADSIAEMTKAKDELKVIQDKLEIANTHLSILREELKFQQADYVHQVDKFIELKEELQEKELEKLALVGTITGKYKSINEAKDNLKDQDIKIVTTSIMDNFDIEAICNKINDGMPKKPADGILENPTGGTSEIITDGLDRSALKVIENIRKMIKTKRINDARALFHKMTLSGVLPENLIFENISTKEGSLNE